MSDDNIENQSDDVMDDLSEGFEDVVGGARDAAKEAAKEVSKKVAKETLKKAVGTAAATAIKSSLITLASSFLLPLIIITLLIVIIYGAKVENKEYSSLVEENKVEGESYERYEGKEEDGDSGLVAYGDGGSSSRHNTSKKTSSKVVLSEGNQAIENYHYYNSSKSVLDNKIYIPLKGIDLEKKASEMYNQLIKKGVIVEEGNERFISEDSLTEVQKSWEKQYGKDGGSFNWTDTKLKNKLDKTINTGITVKGFKDKNIGKLEKVEDEEKKLEIKDEYNREVYFQLPEELLGSLSKTLYDDEFIYDEPFVQGVKYTYKKVDEKDKEEEKEEKENKVEAQSESGKVNKKSADNSVYTAEQFDKEFAKQKGVLRGTGQKFIDYANKYDIDAALAVAIAVEESGRGTSKLARNNFNFFGMKAASGGWRKFNSVEEGIEGGISYISRKYISQGITNIQDIGKIYCVPSEGWIKNVSAHYKTITGREYEGSMAGQGFGSNLTAFRGVPEYDIKLDSYGIGKPGQAQKYGLGTVFLYKPTVEIKVKRGYQVEQTLTTSYGEKKQVGEDEEVPYSGKKNPNQSQPVDGEDGKKVKKTIEYEVKEVDDGNGGKKKVQIKRVYEQEINYIPNAVATPIEEVDAKITYVLDKAITFAGVYEFEYGLELEEMGGESNLSERKIDGTVGSDGKELMEFSKTETKTIKIYEKPMDVKNKSVSTKYMDEYLGNFEATVPKNIMNKFDVNKLVNAFKGEKKIESTTSNKATTSGGEDEVVRKIEENMRDDAERIGKQYGIDPNLLLTIIYVESKGDHHCKRDGSQFWSLGQIGHKETTDSHKYMPGYNLTDDLATDDRWPHCPANGHDESEHQRVEEFHLEYLAKRHTHEMKKYIKSKYGKNAENGLTEEEIQSAIPVGLMSYNIGGGNVGRIRERVGYDDSIFGPDGTRFGDIMRKYNIGNPAGNGDHLMKLYRDYKLFSNGVPLEESAKLGVYDPTLWFDLGDIGKVDSSKNSASSISTGTNGAGMNIENIKAYKEFEKTGGSLSGTFKSGTVVKKLSYEESDLIRKSAIGMIEGKAAYDVTSEKGAYWGSGYASSYFDEGLPSKPLYGDEMSSTIWNGKIRETSQYTGDKDSILTFSKMYGNEVYQIVKRAISQDNKEFEVGGAGPYSFDHSGLLWYVYNYGSKIKYFDKDTIEGYYETIKTEVPNGDIRPGDVIFYTADKEKTVPDKIGIYLGQKAYLYICDKEKIVTIGEYEDLKNNEEYKIIAERRILKYSSTTGEGTLDTGLVGQLPADLVKGDWAHPLGAATYRKTSPLGYRKHPITGQNRSYHTGVDWALPIGNGVYAAKAGTVIVSKFQPLSSSGRSAGEYIVLKHDDGYTTMYAHLSKRGVKVGDTVQKGQLIGLVGNTGGSIGPHLHFEIVKDVPGHFGGKKAEYPSGNYVDANKIFG